MRDAGTETPRARCCSGSVARVSKKRNVPEEKSRARFLRGAWAWVYGFRLVLVLVLGFRLVLVLGLSRRLSPSPSPSPSPSLVSRAGARFLRGFPSAVPASPGALPTKRTRQNALLSFVLGFVWCASPVCKSRLYGTITPRSAVVCHSDALHLPAGVVARFLRFRLVLGFVWFWVLSLKSRVFSWRHPRPPAHFRRILRGYPRPRGRSFCVLAWVSARFRLVLGIIGGFSGCVFQLAQVS